MVKNVSRLNGAATSVVAGLVEVVRQRWDQSKWFIRCCCLAPAWAFLLLSSARVVVQSLSKFTVFQQQIDGFWVSNFHLIAHPPQYNLEHQELCSLGAMRDAAEREECAFSEVDREFSNLMQWRTALFALESQLQTDFDAFAVDYDLATPVNAFIAIYICTWLFLFLGIIFDRSDCKMRTNRVKRTVVPMKVMKCSSVVMYALLPLLLFIPLASISISLAKQPQELAAFQKAMLLEGLNTDHTASPLACDVVAKHFDHLKYGLRLRPQSFHGPFISIASIWHSSFFMNSVTSKRNIATSEPVTIGTVMSMALLQLFLPLFHYTLIGLRITCNALKNRRRFSNTRRRLVVIGVLHAPANHLRHGCSSERHVAARDDAPLVLCEQCSRGSPSSDATSATSTCRAARPLRYILSLIYRWWFDVKETDVPTPTCRIMCHDCFEDAHVRDGDRFQHDHNPIMLTMGSVDDVVAGRNEFSFPSDAQLLRDPLTGEARGSIRERTIAAHVYDVAMVGTGCLLPEGIVFSCQDKPILDTLSSLKDKNAVVVIGTIAWEPSGSCESGNNAIAWKYTAVPELESHHCPTAMCTPRCDPSMLGITTYRVSGFLHNARTIEAGNIDDNAARGAGGDCGISSCLSAITVEEFVSCPSASISPFGSDAMSLCSRHDTASNVTVYACGFQCHISQSSIASLRFVSEAMTLSRDSNAGDNGDEAMTIEAERTPANCPDDRDTALGERWSRFVVNSNGELIGFVHRTEGTVMSAARGTRGNSGMNDESIVCKVTPIGDGYTNECCVLIEAATQIPFVSLRFGQQWERAVALRCPRFPRLRTGLTLSHAHSCDGRLQFSAISSFDNDGTPDGDRGGAQHADLLLMTASWQCTNGRLCSHPRTHGRADHGALPRCGQQSQPFGSDGMCPDECGELATTYWIQRPTSSAVNTVRRVKYLCATHAAEFATGNAVALFTLCNRLQPDCVGDAVFTVSASPTSDERALSPFENDTANDLAHDNDDDERREMVGDAQTSQTPPPSLPASTRLGTNAIDNVEAVFASLDTSQGNVSFVNSVSEDVMAFDTHETIQVDDHAQELFGGDNDPIRAMAEARITCVVDDATHNESKNCKSDDSNGMCTTGTTAAVFTTIESPMSHSEGHTIVPHDSAMNFDAFSPIDILQDHGAVNVGNDDEFVSVCKAPLTARMQCTARIDQAASSTVPPIPSSPAAVTIPNSPMMDEYYLM